MENGSEPGTCRTTSRQQKTGTAKPRSVGYFRLFKTKRAIHFGFVTGDLCKKSFGVKNRKQTARYIIQHLSELQAITHSTSTKVIDDLVEKENESGRNSDVKSDSVTDK